MIKRRKMFATSRIWRDPNAYQEMLTLNSDGEYWVEPVFVLSPEQYKKDLREAFDAGTCYEAGICHLNFEAWVQHKL